MYAGSPRRVGPAGGVEEGEAIAVFGIELAVAVRAAALLIVLDDLAAEVHVFVEQHLLPVRQSHAALLAVHAAKLDRAVAHRPQQHSRHRLAGGIEHLDLGIDRRIHPGRFGFDNPLVAGLGGELIQILIERQAAVAAEDDARGHAGHWNRCRLARLVVGLGFGHFRQVTLRRLRTVIDLGRHLGQRDERLIRLRRPQRRVDKRQGCRRFGRRRANLPWRRAPARWPSRFACRASGGSSCLVRSRS